MLALARDIRQKRINRASDGREEPGYDPFMCTAAEPTGPCGDLIRWLDQHHAPAVRMITNGASLPAWRAVPETICISGTAVQISADLWRDFMPSPSPDDRLLIAAVRVSTAAGGLLPAVRADRIMVISGEQA